MNPNHGNWRAAMACLDELMDLPLPEQQRYLNELANTQPPLYTHVQALLNAHEKAASRNFMDPVPGGTASAHTSLHSGMRLGQYSILQLLGQGGMGEVWLAQRDDGLYDGKAAIKILHPHFTSTALRDRFRREAQLLGRLVHPNIAQLLDAGIADIDGSGPGGLAQIVYLVLEYVPGQPIDIWSDQQQLSIRERVSLFIKLCEAVAHAHANLVVHRDLKPGNVLITESGQLKLLDFGIGKLVEQEQIAESEKNSQSADSSELTRLSGRIFTPEYAAPEQITGDSITTATDVFSLGALLYFILCGCRPFTGSTTIATEHAVLHTEPEPLGHIVRDATSATLAARSTTARQLQRELTGDLAHIVTRAMRKAPQERYASVAALIEDLQRYLDHRPVMARAGSRSYLMKRFMQRHRIAVLATAGIFVSVVAGLSGIVWNANAAREQARIAQLESNKATLESKKAKAVKDFLLGIFNANSELHPDGARARQTTAEELLDIASKKVLADNSQDFELQVELLTTLGNLNHQIQKIHLAETLKRKCLQLLREHLGPTHQRTLAAQVSLATTLAQERKLADSQAMFQEVIDIHHKLGIASSMELGIAELRVGQLTYSQTGAGDPRPLQYFHRAISILEKYPASPYLAEAQVALADGLNLVGDHKQALAAGLRAIELANAVHEPKSKVAADGHASAAVALRELGQLDKAEQHIRQAIEIYTFAHGPKALTTLYGRNDLAQILLAEGKFREAAKELQDVVNLIDATSNDDIDYSLSARISLADAYRYIGDFANARKQLQRYLSPSASPNNLEYKILIYERMARVELEAGDIAKASSYSQRGMQLIAGNEKLYSYSLIIHAMILAKQGHNAEANSIMTGEMQLIPDRDRSVKMGAMLATAYVRIEQQRYDKAIEIAQQVIKLLIDSPLPAGWTTLNLEDAHEYLATALRAIGKYRESCQSLQTAIKLRSSYALPIDPRLKKDKSQFAQCHLNDSRLAPTDKTKA